jgi:hypothetical protein
MEVWAKALRDVTRTLRDGYAGKSTDYAYSVRERCTLVDPEARAEALKRAKQRRAALRGPGRAKATMPTLAATRREIAQLDRVVNLTYGDLMPVNEGPMSPDGLPDFVALMLRPSARLAQPDPELRYADVEKKFATVTPDADMPGRFTVLSIVRYALQASIGDVSKMSATPATPASSSRRSASPRRFP